MKPAQVALMRQLAAEGASRKECAARLGVCYATIHHACHRYVIKFKRGDLTVGKPDERSSTMAALYEEGFTLQQIGDRYGVTRERVRQLIKKRHGMTCADGGQHKRAEDKRRSRADRLDAQTLQKHGCTWEQYKGLLAIGRGVGSRERTPVGAFTRQRTNAKVRGIEWTLTLWQWWNLWQASGCWDKRGRGTGYMMCRVGDAGSYEMGNVYIATGVHNAKIQPNNPYRKGHPDYPEAIARLSEKIKQGQRAAA